MDRLHSETDASAEGRADPRLRRRAAQWLRSAVDGSAASAASALAGPCGVRPIAVASASQWRRSMIFYPETWGATVWIALLLAAVALASVWLLRRR